MSDTDAEISVVIADDQLMLAEALGFMVAQTPGMRMAAPPVGTPEALIEACRTFKPGVALIDLVYDGVIAGIHATSRIIEVSPSTQVVVMTSHQDPHLLLEAVESGAAGFLKKTEAVELLLDTIRGAASGRVMIEPEVLAQVIRESAKEAPPAAVAPPELTPRETEVLDLLSSGLSNRDIAEKLVLSVGTVETHVHHVLDKLGARSRLEAVVIAGRVG